MTDMARPERLEKTDDLAADLPWSIEAPEPSNFQFERPDWRLFASVSTLPTLEQIARKLGRLSPYSWAEV
jgi:hypothetical protein